MHSEELTELVIAPAETDADLEALIAVRKAVDPRARPKLANLRHALRSSTNGLVFLVARVHDEPVGCGFVEASSADFAQGDITVVAARRRRGVGSALLAEALAIATGLEKTALQLEVRKSDDTSRSFLERRGFTAVGGEEAVSLALEPQPPAPPVPRGVEILSRRERPDLAHAMYEVYVDAVRDVPGAPLGESFESWSAREIGRPSRSPDLSFLALVGEEVVGYAVLDVFGDEGRHGFTAVKRTWRRRGVATALKRAQIAAAWRSGLERLITGSEDRNLPMRALNEKLGYRPDPERSTVAMRGPV